MSGYDLTSLAARFDRFSLRERLLTGAALLGLAVYAWDAWLMGPVTTRGKAVESAVQALRGEGPQIGTAQLDEALARAESLRREIERVDASLAEQSAGLIEPQRMVEVLRGVLAGQRDLTLVSLQNLPARPLVPAETADAPESGPYVHTVELAIEGSYLATLEYLRALERLPWRFYWRSVEIETREHPRQRVRIELSTLSPQREWLGV